MRRPTADLMLLATVALWAANFTVSKYILDHGFHPLAYASVRYAIAATIFAAITLAWEGSLRIGRGDVALVAGATTVLFINQLCFIYALRFTTATTAALLFGTLPIFTAVLVRGTGVEPQRCSRAAPASSSRAVASGSRRSCRSAALRSSRSARVESFRPTSRVTRSL